MSQAIHFNFLRSIHHSFESLNEAIGSRYRGAGKTTCNARIYNLDEDHRTEGKHIHTRSGSALPAWLQRRDFQKKIVGYRMDIINRPHQKPKNVVITILIFLSSLIAVQPIFPSAVEQKQKSLAAFKAGSHIALVRHALAPGIGDPDNFRLDECSTQRNLSELGRKQAAAIGMKFRAAGITSAEVFTSQWCRCRETAELMALGEPVELPMLNSFFHEIRRKEQQIAQLHQWLSGKDLTKPIILVTHQVNITAFSGVYPESGEIILMRKTVHGGFELSSKISAN